MLSINYMLPTPKHRDPEAPPESTSSSSFAAHRKSARPPQHQTLSTFAPMDHTKKSAQKKAAGASLARRRLPPRSEKSMKRSERGAKKADMHRQEALFPSIYASDPEL